MYQRDPRLQCGGEPAGLGGGGDRGTGHVHAHDDRTDAGHVASKPVAGFPVWRYQQHRRQAVTNDLFGSRSEGGPDGFGVTAGADDRQIDSFTLCDVDDHLCGIAVDDMYVWRGLVFPSDGRHEALQLVSRFCVQVYPGFGRCGGDRGIRDMNDVQLGGAVPRELDGDVERHAGRSRKVDSDENTVWRQHRRSLRPHVRERGLGCGRFGSPGSLIVSTGQAAVRRTRSVTLPSRKCDRPVRPWVPMTIKSTSHAAACATIIRAACPRRTTEWSATVRRSAVDAYADNRMEASATSSSRICTGCGKIDFRTPDAGEKRVIDDVKQLDSRPDTRGKLTGVLRRTLRMGAEINRNENASDGVCHRCLPRVLHSTVCASRRVADTLASFARPRAVRKPPARKRPSDCEKLRVACTAAHSPPAPCMRAVRPRRDLSGLSPAVVVRAHTLQRKDCHREASMNVRPSILCPSTIRTRPRAHCDMRRRWPSTSSRA